jgi:hypothetical protein
MLVSTHHEFRGKNKLGWIFVDVQMLVFLALLNIIQKAQMKNKK